MRLLSTILIALAVAAGAGPSKAACNLFDGVDVGCPGELDYVSKRVRFFCGHNPRYQMRHSSGDCSRFGHAYGLRQFTLNGVPAIRWNKQGAKSRATIATGCYCIIDE